MQVEVMGRSRDSKRGERIELQEGDLNTQRKDDKKERKRVLFGEGVHNGRSE